jgi:DedD protein
VIVLPLLLEDEPPPASSLAVKMAAAPEPVSAAESGSAEVATVMPPQSEPRIDPDAAPESKREPAKPAPVKAEPVKPVPKPLSAKPSPSVAQAKPAADAVFVVQLAALSDAAKADELKARAAQAGLPAYIDSVGALTRVRVGPYPSREAAVAAAVMLAERGMAGQVVAK